MSFYKASLALAAVAAVAAAPQAQAGAVADFYKGK